MEILQALANALDVRVSDFLFTRDEHLVFSHGEFRKSLSLPSSQQEYIRESVEDYLTRFMTTVEILGGDILPRFPSCHSILLSQDEEKNALLLRSHLGFALDGPIDDLIGKLENKGILVYACKVDNRSFSGLNGFVNDRPYIVVNADMSPERNRSTIVHELAHLMFIWPDDMSEKDAEKMATAIGGAFLFPRSDAIRELGFRRSTVSKDMTLTAQEFGISMMLLVKRAELCHIISSSVAKEFFVKASRAGWRTAEPSRIEKETPVFFRQLVLRAVNEREITVQRGAELLRSSVTDVLFMQRFGEVL